MLAQIRNNAAKAVRFESAAANFRKSFGFKQSSVSLRWDVKREALHDAMSEAEYANAQQQGKALTWDEAVAQALEFCDSE